MSSRSDAVSESFPPISDYAFIGDCHSTALVSREASIDWCCMPRFDSGSLFGRLLDRAKGGFCSIVPVEDNFTSTRSYVDRTMVLATEFASPGGTVRVLDGFSVHEGGASDPHRQLFRVVEGLRGTMELRLRISPRFDYGGVKPWIRHFGPGLYGAVGGSDALLLWSDADLAPVDGHDVGATFSVRSGQRVRLSMVWTAPETLDAGEPQAPGPDEIDRRVEETLRWWRSWSGRMSLGGPHGPGVGRSALVLKALTNAPTGAVAAAVTTSLPESIGGGRNWDYRFSWIRDSQFTVRSLTALGYAAEADGFRRFIERSAAGSGEDLQVMYGLGGERRLTELTLDLDGYRGSRPVRAGNAASDQLQLDAYGELLDLAWRWHERGSSPDDDYWRFLVSLVDVAAARWEEPDCGLWEMRGRPQHFVHSKVMCWAALDRGLRLSQECMRKAPERRWSRTRDEIRAAVESQGYDEGAGTFVQAFGGTDLDAALLLLPSVDFVAYDDERMLRTTDAVRAQLDDGGLLRRYCAEDGLDGREGAFLACAFWLAECLARQGRAPDARAVFDRAISTGNDLGLFSEEYDPRTDEQLGNFPQGLTHLSHIAAAVALSALDEPN
ncbi:MAG: glycoside hydrolase family 15 protein [Actinomycetota bacterium]|nr:glycoside hydrolase family 15 protein [Actinomycetota bacterium]